MERIIRIKPNHGYHEVRNGNGFLISRPATRSARERAKDLGVQRDRGPGSQLDNSGRLIPPDAMVSALYAQKNSHAREESHIWEHGLTGVPAVSLLYDTQST